jgi:hypothetical protein
MAAITNTSSGIWFTGGGAGYAQISGDKAGLSYRVRRELKKRGFLVERNTIPPLAAGGIGAGGAVNASYTRAAYGPVPPLTPGGVQPVETVTVHTGVTTASDAATVAGLANLATQPGYVRNGDGNPRANNGG